MRIILIDELSSFICIDITVRFGKVCIIVISVSIIFTVFLSLFDVSSFWSHPLWLFIKFYIFAIVFSFVSIVFLIPFCLTQTFINSKLSMVPLSKNKIQYPRFSTICFLLLLLNFFLWLSLNFSNMTFLVFLKHFPVSRPLQLGFLYLNIFLPNFYTIHSFTSFLPALKF